MLTRKSSNQHNKANTQTQHQLNQHILDQHTYINTDNYTSNAAHTKQYITQKRIQAHQQINF